MLEKETIPLFKKSKELELLKPPKFMVLIFSIAIFCNLMAVILNMTAGNYLAGSLHLFSTIMCILMLRNIVLPWKKCEKELKAEKLIIDNKEKEEKEYQKVVDSIKYLSNKIGGNK